MRHLQYESSNTTGAASSCLHCIRFQRPATTARNVNAFLAVHSVRQQVVVQVEAELQELEEEEAKEYLQSLGVEEGGLHSLIAATYKQLGLLTYFTTGRACCLPMRSTSSRQNICAAPRYSCSVLSKIHHLS